LESLDQKMKMRLQQGFATGEMGVRAQFAQQLRQLGNAQRDPSRLIAISMI